MHTRNNDLDFEEFGSDDVKFKRLHNKAFVALVRYCQRERIDAAKRGLDNNNIDNDGINDDGIVDPNVFYLDGPDASTLSVLIDVLGFNPHLCYVANLHASTCNVLRRTLPSKNIILTPTAKVLAPPLHDRSCLLDHRNNDGEGGATPPSAANLSFRTSTSLLTTSTGAAASLPTLWG